MDGDVLLSMAIDSARFLRVFLGERTVFLLETDTVMAQLTVINGIITSIYNCILFYIIISQFKTVKGHNCRNR